MGVGKFDPKNAALPVRGRRPPRIRPIARAPADLGTNGEPRTALMDAQFGASGRGQSLIVWPDLDMVVVITAGGNAGQLAPLIRQAVKSAAALPRRTGRVPGPTTESRRREATAASNGEAFLARNGQRHFRSSLSLSD